MSSSSSSPRPPRPTSSRRFPRYLTFRQPGDMEAFLRERLGLAPDAPLPAGWTAPTDASAAAARTPRGNPSRRSPFVKEHTLADVAFPDGTTGRCRYERRGPSWHLFHYAYRDGSELPVQTWWQRLPGGDVPAVEAKARELAAACYAEACRQERDRYFRRASLPADGSRLRLPDKAQMTVARAKELGGRYALCWRHDGGLFAVSASFESLEAANAAWREKGDRRLVVACCNRLDRCWELPRYNPLYAEFDPREPLDPRERGETEAKEGGDQP